jgi:hypothetical protein
MQPRTYAVGGVVRTVLEEESYEATETRVVDVPVTVVEQQVQQLLAAVQPADPRSAEEVVAVATPGLSPRKWGSAVEQSRRALQLCDREIVDPRSMVGPPGGSGGSHTGWRLHSRGESSPSEAWPPVHTRGVVGSLPEARPPLRTPLALLGAAAALDARRLDVFDSRAAAVRQWHEWPAAHTPSAHGVREAGAEGLDKAVDPTRLRRVAISRESSRAFHIPG